MEMLIANVHDGVTNEKMMYIKVKKIHMNKQQADARYMIHYDIKKINTLNLT